MAVVLIMKMQSMKFIDAIWVSNYSYGDLQHIFWDFENLNFMQSKFFAIIMTQLRHVGPRPEMGSNLGVLL